MKSSIRTAVSVTLALVVLAILPVLAGDGQGDKVVVTKPGVVFHKAGSGDVRGRGVEKSVDAALEAGYTPCPVCFAKELAAVRGGSPDVMGGASTAKFASTGESIPDPPVSTVTQPFGLRYASTRYLNSAKNGVRNPYEDLRTVIPGRAEQGAYSDR